MKIRSTDQARTITFPDGRALAVTPEGVEVPADLEGEARQVVELHEHIEEVGKAKKKAEKNEVPK